MILKRNDLCWCGSGKKYKRCHMQQDAQKRWENSPRPRNRMVKTPSEFEGMRRAGAFNGELLDYIRPHVKEGVNTAQINRLVHEYTVKHGATPAPLNYHGFPKSACISINNVVCHGIPNEMDVLKDGDIVNVDVTSILEGYHGDSSETFFIGNVSDEARRLVQITAQALIRGIRAVKPGILLSAIADAIEPYVESEGCSVVRQYTGHGIGRKFHEHFTVYHHRAKDNDHVVLQPGMTLTIEPMINLGGYRVVTDHNDGWTVRTKDGSLSAQFEHTIGVTEDGVEILTLTPRQKAEGKVLIVDGVEIDV